MNCSNCGNKIEDGKLYCDFCGKPVQVVPDYNAFDDEALASILTNQQKNPNEKPSKKNSNGKKSSGKVKISKKKKIVLYEISGMILAAIIGAVLYFHSGKYYYSVGEAKDKAKQYEEAIPYYEKSEETYPVKARTKIGNDYYLLQQYDKAEEILLEAIDLNGDYAESYRVLLKVYQETGDFESMQRLKENVTSDRILKLFSAYVTDTVTFSEDGGSYSDDISLELSAPTNYTIYYTLDGTAPSAKNGEKYKKEIELTDGTTTVKAVCVNADGEAGEVVSKTYKISYAAPDYPVVTPSSGTYHSETLITMTANSSERIYYTWDGSIPTSDSMEYIDPIIIPEGNHILSVIVVNEHGMSSSVLKMNYQYLP